MDTDMPEPRGNLAAISVMFICGFNSSAHYVKTFSALHSTASPIQFVPADKYLHMKAFLTQSR